MRTFEIITLKFNHIQNRIHFNNPKSYTWYNQHKLKKNKKHTHMFWNIFKKFKILPKRITKIQKFKTLPKKINQTYKIQNSTRKDNQNYKIQNSTQKDKPKL